MIESTKTSAPTPTTAPAAAEPSQPAAERPFEVWLGVSANGEDAFVPPPAWGQYSASRTTVTARPEITTATASGSVAVPPSLTALVLPEDSIPVSAMPATTASAAYQAAPQAAGVDTAKKPPSAAVAAPVPTAPALTANGEEAFVPPSVDDEVRRAAYGKGNVSLFAEGDEPTVWDFIDLINPLQHIPVINLIYRELTGDKIGALPQIIGGTVLGGPVGAVAAVANVVAQETTGKDLGANVMALFEDDAPAPTRLADGQTPAAASGGKPAGKIEVIAPAPANFIPYGNAPAGVLPEAEAAAQEKAEAEAAKAEQAASADQPQPSAEAVRRAATAQGLAESDHPMLAAAATATRSTTQTAPKRRAVSASDSVQPQAAPANSGDFVAKFMSAMDKYDKATRLTGEPAKQTED